jgi:hypothetical protein
VSSSEEGIRRLDRPGDTAGGGRRRGPCPVARASVVPADIPLRALLLAAAFACGCAAEPPRLEVRGGSAMVVGVEGPAGTAAEEEVAAGGAAVHDETGAVAAGAAVRARGGELVRARWELRNGGGRPLVLHGVVPDCGCRLGESLSDALERGESAALVVLCRAPHGGGEAVREMRLLSSDPERPETPLRVAITVAAPAAEPPALHLGYVPVGGSAERELVVEAEGAAPGSCHPAVSVEPRPGSRSDGRRAFRVRFAPRESGVLRTALDLGAEAGAVPVSGVGFKTVAAYPAEVRAPDLAPVVVKALGEAAVELVRVEYPPGIAGEARTVVPGRQFRLALRLDPRRAAGTRGVPAGEDRAIRIHTTDPDEPVLVVPVLGPGAGPAAACEAAP